MRALSLAVGLMLGSVSIAHAAPQKTWAQVKRIVKKEVSPKDGWLPNITNAGYKRIDLNALKGRIATTAIHLYQVADTFDVFQKKFGTKKVFVIDSSVDNGYENGSNRSVFNARGKTLF